MNISPNIYAAPDALTPCAGVAAPYLAPDLAPDPDLDLAPDFDLRLRVLRASVVRSGLTPTNGKSRLLTPFKKNIPKPLRWRLFGHIGKSSQLKPLGIFSALPLDVQTIPRNHCTALHFFEARQSKSKYVKLSQSEKMSVPPIRAVFGLATLAATAVQHHTRSLQRVAPGCTVLQRVAPKIFCRCCSGTTMRVDAKPLIPFSSLLKVNQGISSLKSTFLPIVHLIINNFSEQPFARG